jgi:hypothetical protein
LHYFSTLFWYATLHVSDRLSITRSLDTVFTAIGICHTDSWWWTVNLSETCRVVYKIKLRNSASYWLLLYESSSVCVVRGEQVACRQYELQLSDLFKLIFQLLLPLDVGNTVLYKENTVESCYIGFWMWTAAGRVKSISSPSVDTSICRDRIVSGVRCICSGTALYLANSVAFLLIVIAFHIRNQQVLYTLLEICKWLKSASQMTNVTRSLIPWYFVSLKLHTVQKRGYVGSCRKWEVLVHFRLSYFVQSLI